MTLREKLIVSRNKAGLSQMELAERLGVSRQAVSRWESGDTTPTICAAMPRIANPPKQQNQKQTGPRTMPLRERKVRKNRKSGPSRSHWRSS